MQAPLLARPFRIEEGDLAAPRVASKEREAVRALDLVHSGDLRDDRLERHTLVDPECNMVEGGRIHVNDIPPSAPGQPVLP